MQIIRKIKSLRKKISEIKLKGKAIGFVPTMGALHEGHLSLIRQARKVNDFVVVSIFVNPIQFGPKEDFKKYPRDIRSDAKLCNREGVDIIFYPDPRQMYPDNYKTYIEVQGLSDVLCGKFRPAHFRGVTTIVTKLFNIAQPDIAYFGQKDAQQAIIIKKMADDLNIPVKIKVIPTIRHKDGLALSSRNIYLSQDERRDATVLYQALNLAKNLIRQGNTNPLAIIQRIKQLINQKKTAKIQYISIVDLKDLEPVDKIKDRVLIALAVWMGKTRLIDNVIMNSKMRKV